MSAELDSRSSDSALGFRPSTSLSAISRPIRVMVLRCVDGTGGGADKIILRNAATVDPARIDMTVCFVRNRADTLFDFDQRSERLGLKYREVLQRHPLDQRVVAGLRSVADEISPDIIHTHDYKSSYLASRFAKPFGCKLMSTSHGWTGNSFRERFVYYPGDKLILRRFAKVLAVSNDIKNTLSNWGVSRSKVRVILNGIDPDAYLPDPAIRDEWRAKLGLQRDEIALGAVGRLERQKRFDILIKMFAKLRIRRPELKLFIAGEGSLGPELQKLINQLQIGQSCKLLGHCPRMIDTYQAFDMLVQSSDYEGTPTVVVEAMALRIPVVATDAGGTSQLAYENYHALIVPKRDPQALADAIEQTLDDPKATQQRIERARNRVEDELSFDYRTRQLEDIYAGLLDEE